MKTTIAIVSLSLLISCANKLEEKEQTLVLSYIVWGCDCANWVTPEDIDKYHDAGDLLAEHSIFIEPADSSLSLPDSLSAHSVRIKFTGHFYKHFGYPKGYSSNEFPSPDKAPVFRYTKYELLNH